MRRLRVLFIAHGHPDLYVGGAEVFAYELFRGLRELGNVDAVFLARTMDSGHVRTAATPFRAHRDRRDEILWLPGPYDPFYQSLVEKDEYSVAFRELLHDLRPDVVHVQHTSGIGFGVLREIRRVVPGAAIVYTLHEFLPICHAKGLMVTATTGQLCEEATPMRCHGCFPAVPPSHFLLREKVIQAELRHVDRFVAPSHFLRRRFTEWGLPEAKIVFEEYGRLPIAASEPSEPPPIRNFAFLGQFAPHKGLEVLLQAMRLVAEPDPASVRLFLHGSNLERQPETFQRHFNELLAACPQSVVLAGSYATRDIPRLLRDIGWVVVPSVWWENSPLVIQEAFAMKRPVITSDIGGMAEKVQDGVNGLHFRAGDPDCLAATLRRASSSPDLWEALQGAIRPVHTMRSTIEFHLDLYRSLLEEKRHAQV